MWATTVDAAVAALQGGPPEMQLLGQALHRMKDVEQNQIDNLLFVRCCGACFCIHVSMEKILHYICNFKVCNLK